MPPAAPVALGARLGARQSIRRGLPLRLPPLLFRGTSSRARPAEKQGRKPEGNPAPDGLPCAEPTPESDGSCRGHGEGLLGEAGLPPGPGRGTPFREERVPAHFARGSGRRAPT